MEKHSFFALFVFTELCLIFLLPMHSFGQYQNLRVTSSSSYWNNGTWSITVSSEIGYDSLGRVVMKDNYDNTRSYQTYDHQGNLTFILFQAKAISHTDSFYNSRQINMFYNLSKLCTLSIVKRWSSGFWQNDTRTILHYTSFDSISDSTVFLWQDTVWLNSKKYTAQFTNYKPTIELWQVWNTSFLAWGNSTRRIRAFDSYDSLILDIRSNWGQGVWDTLSIPSPDRYSFTHLSSNRLEIIYEQYSNHQWVNSERNIWGFDSANRKISRQYQQWSTTGLWNNPSSMTYNYSAKGYDTCQFSLSWNTSTNSLDTVRRINTPYDSHGNNLGTIYWLRDTLNKTWKFQTGYLSQYAYDNSEHVVEKINSQWNATLLDYQFTNREQSTYDLFGRLIQRIFQRWNIEFSAWENTTKHAFVYTPNTSIVHNTSKHFFSMLPSLKGTRLFLPPNQLNRVIFYTLTGRAIRSLCIPSTVNQIELNNSLLNNSLPPGLYAISVFSNNQAVWRHPFVLVK